MANELSWAVEYVQLPDWELSEGLNGSPSMYTLSVPEAKVPARLVEFARIGELTEGIFVVGPSTVTGAEAAL